VKWVLVDVSFLAYRALHTVGHLAVEETPTGVLFGFFSQLRSICQDPRVDSNKIALFFDSKKSYREKAYPLYKKKRRQEQPEERIQQINSMWDQVKILRNKILPAIGVPCFLQAGLESDDLIAHASRSLIMKAWQDKGPRGVIITADGDLYQCINPACHWYDPSRSKYFDVPTFLAAKGIHPSRWGEVKVIGGCSSDNVTGVPGVGEKTAVDFLKGQLPKKYKRYQAIVSDEGKEIRERNRDLVVLPHPKTKAFELTTPIYNSDAFFHYCERYGLVSFLNKKGGWLRFWEGRKFKPRMRAK